MAWDRIETNSNPEQRLQDSPAALVLLLAAVGAAGLLAMFATWLLVAGYPIPDDEAIYLGSLGFFFVVFLDAFLVSYVVGSEVRQGQRIAAVKKSVGLILLGLFVASVVGSLPWFLGQLNAALPWVREIPWGILLASWLLTQDLRRRRKQTADDRKHSWKSLIFLGSLLILFIASTLWSAFSGFSDGKAWLGTIHLVVSVMLMLLVVNVFMEILKIWRRRRDGSAA